LRDNGGAVELLALVPKHLRRTWLRTGSTVAAVGLCVFLFCTLQSVLAEVDSYVRTRSPRRLITGNLLSGGLPLAHGPQIERVPGVRRVAAGLIFAGFLRAKREGLAEPGSGATQWTTFFHNMAVDAEPYFAMNPELRVPTDQFRGFLADPRGCVVGRKLAEKLGFDLGDHFFLESIVPAFQKPSGPFEFVVRGLIDPDLKNHPGTPADVMFFHLQYLDVLPRVRGWTVNFMVEVEDPARAAQIASRIDALFENSSEQTITGTEKAFAADLAAQAGELSQLLNGIGLAMCFTILLVTANTMSMAVRERRTEIAVLKTIGFRSVQVMTLVVVESLLLGTLGGAIGIAATVAALWAVNAMPGVALPGLAAVSLRTTVMLLGLGMALAIGLLAGLLPAWTAYRARVTEMLRAI
jgi:putative ABC transport system permease protein